MKDVENKWWNERIQHNLATKESEPKKVPMPINIKAKRHALLQMAIIYLIIILLSLVIAIAIFKPHDVSTGTITHIEEVTIRSTSYWIVELDTSETLKVSYKYQPYHADIGDRVEISHKRGYATSFEVLP